MQKITPNRLNGRPQQQQSHETTPHTRPHAAKLFVTGTPAALAWGGTKWTVLKVPGPGDGKAAAFDGISCPVNGQCVTSGEISKANPAPKEIAAPTEIAGYWNGRTWRYGPM